MTSSLQYLIGQDLTWVPTATFKARYQLIARDDTLLATLNMSNWTTKANATVPEGTLFIQKETWSGLKIAISLGEQGPLLANYQRRWIGTSGQLLFPDGREFKWGRVNFWGTQKAWIDPRDNTAYVQFSTGGFSRKVKTVINPPAAIPELSLLLVLGLYNILVERRDAAAASSSASF